MKVNGEIIGGVGISFPQPHVFDEGECDFLESLTDQCAQALERARLYATEQQARIKAEEADHLKMRFLAMISHELRTPLTSIKGFSTTLLATDITWDESSQTEFIEIIDQESDKLTGLVDDLLDMSRLQIGTLRITPEVRPLEFIIQNARANLETLARDHVLSIQVPAGMPPVMADATRIAQVISNLVSNAVRYSPAGTKIDVSAHQVGEMIQIDVSDEGEGIPATDRTLVFEAFRQLDRKNEGHKKGAGLGLAICKGMVEAHGGHIWIQDRPGAGTTISFTIPVAR
jgi:two-component system, OmpR family, sensor histidine kinase KdpD